MRLCTLSLALFVATCGTSAAQSAAPADSLQPARQLSELVVTAQRSLTPLGVVPEAITVLRADRVRSRQLRTAPEALSALPGIFVQKTNHGGGSPFVRGLTGNQTLLLVDGIRLSNATFRYGPNQYFNTLDVFSLDRIEALRGSGSVQYGSDALGGAIQAFTRDVAFGQTKKWGGEVLWRGATQGMEQSARASVQHSGRRVAFVGGLTWRDFGDLVGGDTTGRQTPSGYRELAADAKLKWALSSRSVLTVAHQNVRQQHVPVFHKVQLEDFALNEFEPQSRQLSYARLEQQLGGQLLQSLTATASWHQTTEGRNSQKNGSSVLRHEEDRVGSFGSSVQVGSRLSKAWTANSGVEVYHDRVNSTRTDTDTQTGNVAEKRGLYPDDATLTSVAVFSLHDWDLPRWHFTAGVRWNYFSIEAQDEAVGQARIRPAAWVGNLGVLRKIGDHARVFASVNTAFRAPNVDDLGTLGIVDFRFETPNYDLRPEHSVNSQVGFKFGNPRLQGEVYVFRNELRDLITRVKQDTQTRQGYPLYQKENVERAYIQGLETAWNWQLTTHWTARGSLTYAYGQNLTQREPVRRIPPLFGQLALEYAAGAWSATADWQAADRQSRLAAGDVADNRIPKGGTPGWNVLNLHAGYQWHWLSVRLSALNLFNRDYRTHGSGVNGYGRSVFATVAIRV